MNTEKNIDLEILPCMEGKAIKDLMILLIKKEIITCEELNKCQNSCAKHEINYLHAKEIDPAE